MVEKRIERVREKEKSVLYKSEAGGARPVPASVPVSGPGPATADPHLSGSTLSETETAAIEAELSPEQLQLFAEENDLLLRQYEDALSKVQYVTFYSSLTLWRRWVGEIANAVVCFVQECREIAPGDLLPPADACVASVDAGGVYRAAGDGRFDDNDEHRAGE